MDRFLQARRLTPKKVASRARAAALGVAQQPDADEPARLAFINETWATTNMIRLRRRCKRRRRLVAAVLQGISELPFAAALCVSSPIAVGFGQCHERRCVPLLSRADIGADTETRRCRHQEQSRLALGSPVFAKRSRHARPLFFTCRPSPDLDAIVQSSSSR